MKQGGQHDFNAVWEFCYHALQSFFPKSGESIAVCSDSATPQLLYSLSGIVPRISHLAPRIYIADGRKIVR